jgi:hypothetical protein
MPALTKASGSLSIAICASSQVAKTAASARSASERKSRWLAAEIQPTRPASFALITKAIPRNRGTAWIIHCKNITRCGNSRHSGRPSSDLRWSTLNSPFAASWFLASRGQPLPRQWGVNSSPLSPRWPNNLTVTIYSIQFTTFVKVASIGMPIIDWSDPLKPSRIPPECAAVFSCTVVIGFAFSIGVRPRHEEQAARFAYPSNSLKSRVSVCRYRE